MRITLFVTFFLFGIGTVAYGFLEFGDVLISLVERRTKIISLELLYDVLLHIALAAFCFLLSLFCLKYKE